MQELEFGSVRLGGGVRSILALHSGPYFPAHRYHGNISKDFSSFVEADERIERICFLP